MLFEFLLTGEGERFQVSLSVAGRSASATFPTAGLNSTHVRSSLQAIESGELHLDDLKTVGGLLWRSLVRDEVGKLYRSQRAIQNAARGFSLYQLRLAPKVAHLPWEALYDEDDQGFLAGNPHCSLLHTPHRVPGVELVAAAPPIRVLAVIPVGADLDSEREFNNLARCVQRYEGQVELEPLRGDVTPSRLKRKLRDEEWHVVHYVGHGRWTSQSQGSEIRLNADDSAGAEVWLDQEGFATLFAETTVRLVVLNSCYGEAGPQQRSLSGFGRQLLSVGVPAVIAMRYEILDAEAVRFSREFYEQLFGGRASGLVHRAFEEARNELFVNKRKETVRSFVSPVLFLADPARVLFEIEAPSPAPASAAPRVRMEEARRQADAAKVPQVVRDLAAAVRDGRCVPIVGPGLLRTGVARSEEVPPGPLQLARKLADASDYPRREDFEICERAGEWMAPMVLQWTAQHFLHKRKSHQLIELIEDSYCQPPPPALRRLAAWQAPGFLCTYFDGLLERALRDRGKRLRVANYVDRPVPVAGEPRAGQAAEPLLVHLRGSAREPASLVLTAEHHEALWDALGRLSSQIVALASGRAVSLLFLGVSRRDPLARRLGRALIDTTEVKNQGPAYFACCACNEVDDVFWKPLKVEWIEGDLELLLEQVADLAENPS